MKKVFIFLISILFINTALADLKPIPPYTGNTPEIKPDWVGWIPVEEYLPKVNTEKARAKLEDTKLRFRNALKNYDNMQSIRKKYNSSQASMVKQYDHIRSRLWEIYKETSKEKIFDKESVELLIQALDKNYEYYTSLYKEQNGGESILSVIRDVNEFRRILKLNEEYVIRNYL